MYGSRLRDNKTVKTTLDLRSDNFPGCQVAIYVNVTLLDQLPTADATRPSTKGSIAGKQEDIVNTGKTAKEQVHDTNQNKF